MKDLLRAFLAKAAATPFELGTFDCGLWLADWYVVLTGKPDPAAGLRGNHDGQLWHNVNAVVERIGLEQVDRVRAGDIGIVRVGEVLKGGIFTENGWVTLCEKGLSKVPTSAAVRAWRIS